MAELEANLPSEHQESAPAPDNSAAQANIEIPEFTDEQIASFLQKKGISFDGNFETLKQKVEYIPPAQEPSEEEKSAQQTAEDKRLLDAYLKNVKGGTIEQFTALKGLLNESDTELGRKAAMKELVDNGFTKEQAEGEIKVRYYQKELSELDRDEFDSDEDFEAEKAALQKKIDFGNKKLAGKSQFIKKQAEEVFNKLKQAISNEDLQVQNEAAISSKVDELVSKMPRKMTFELGESNGRKLDPIGYDVSDNDIAEIADTLKNSSKRNELVFDKDGNVNVSTVAELMLRNKILESAIKASYLEGETRQVKALENVFPARAAYQVGVGGAPHKQDTKPGKIVRKGPPSVASFS